MRIGVSLYDNKLYGPEGTEPPNLDDIIKDIDLEEIFEEHRWNEEEYDDYDDGDCY